MESIMAQAGKTLATKSKLTKAAKKVKAIEPKKELVETSTTNKNIGIVAKRDINKIKMK